MEGDAINWSTAFSTVASSVTPVITALVGVAVTVIVAKGGLRIAMSTLSRILR